MANTVARSIAVIIIILAIIGIGFWIFQSYQSDKDQPQATLSLLAFNQTQNKEATSVPAKADDVIIYTLTAENPSDEVIEGFVMEANIGSITNRAVLIDAQGASFNSANNSLVWSPLDIPARGSLQKQFSVRINPLTATESSAVISMSYSNQIDVTIGKTSVVSGNNTYVAPPTGPQSNLVFWFALLTTGIYFVFRLLQSKRFGDNVK